MKIATVAERPDLVEPGWTATRDTLPEYNNHGDVLNRYWGRLTEERPEFQFHIVDGDDILARARSIPVHWDGTVEDLPAGIDGAIARGFDEGGANVLCALVIMVPRNLQTRGLSAVAVEAMREIASRRVARTNAREATAGMAGALCFSSAEEAVEGPSEDDFEPSAEDLATRDSDRRGVSHVSIDINVHRRATHALITEVRKGAIIARPVAQTMHTAGHDSSTSPS